MHKPQVSVLVCTHPRQSLQIYAIKKKKGNKGSTNTSEIFAIALKSRVANFL